jgi:hypothetical protein
MNRQNIQRVIEVVSVPVAIIGSYAFITLFFLVFPR